MATTHAATPQPRGPATTDSGWLVPLSDVEVDGELLEAVEAAVASGWWSMGPRTQELERAFAEFVGSKHALAVSNGTAALHLALLATGCGPGDEVILPSLNFVAAANTIAHVGATPVFCDISGPGDLNMSPQDLSAAISPATKAVVVMHYGGHPCQMDAILDVAAERQLTVVEDAAHAPGARWYGRACGTFGAVGCFSFFSNKNLPVGEGGMVVTDDDEVAERLRLLRSHGMTTLTWDRHRGHAHTYDVVAQGFNYRLDEIKAALAAVQLRRLPERNAARAMIVSMYRGALDGLGGMIVPFAPCQGVVGSHHLAVVVLPEGVARDDVRAGLAEQRIQTSLHYPPIHQFTQYREIGHRRPLPETERVARRLVTLPLYPSMREDQVAAVIEAVLRAVTAE